MHRGLVGAVTMVAVDTGLLMLMLIGLVRDGHRGSVGIWQLLYNQVTLTFAAYLGY